MGNKSKNLRILAIQKVESKVNIAIFWPVLNWCKYFLSQTISHSHKITFLNQHIVTAYDILLVNKKIVSFYIICPIR